MVGFCNISTTRVNPVKKHLHQKGDFLHFVYLKKIFLDQIYLMPRGTKITKIPQVWINLDNVWVNWAHQKVEGRPQNPKNEQIFEIFKFFNKVKSWHRLEMYFKYVLEISNYINRVENQILPLRQTYWRQKINFVW